MSGQQWESETQYWLGVIGYAVGYGNVWRFPYFLFTYGGPAFMLPYILSLVFLGIPVFLIENSIGQMMGHPVSVFRKIHPKFRGIGVSGMILAILICQYYVVLLAWTLIFLVNSFQSPLPWSEPKGGNPWNEDYFEDEVLMTSGNISETGSVHPHLVLALIFSWVLVYLCIWKGVKGAGKILYVTAPAPYVILFCLFLRGITLEGAGKGLEFMVSTELENFFSLTPWRMAGNQVLFSLGMGANAMVLFAAYREKTQRLVRSSIILPIINSCTSLLACATIYTFIGHISSEENLDIEELPLDGPKLAFIAYPISLALMPGNNFWAVAFFAMLLMLGLDSEFALVEAFVSFLEEEKLTNLRREYSAAVVCAAGCLFGLVFTVDSGQYVLYLFDRYTSSISVFLIVLLEVVVVVWIYGVQNLSEEVHKHTGEEFPQWMKRIMKYVTPVICGLLFVMALVSEFLEPPEDFPWWAVLLGWLITCTTLFPLVYFAVFGKEEEKQEIEMKSPESNEAQNNPEEQKEEMQDIEI